MLTRLEARGFKNLLDVQIDFGPFTCIAGPNGVGKSNIFDAIQFLSELADKPLMEAAESVRGTRSERAADPRDLFWDRDRPIELAAEMIVPPTVEDDFGKEARATTTFLRYELSIGYEPASGLERRGRLVLLHESLTHIKSTEAPRRLQFPHSASRFRRKVVLGRRSGTAYISTSAEDTITVHQDGGSRGQPRHASSTRAPATVVRATSLSDDPTILAARREMQSWRRLSLEPSALRTEDRFTDARMVASDGRHLPAALFRLAAEGEAMGEASHDVYARVASRLQQLAGLSVDSVEVDVDETRELFTVKLRERSGREFPARSLSEGTLRFLALCVIHEDAAFGGVICMEEPENGIHPANIDAMVRLVSDLAVDPHAAPGRDNPVRQVIVNTHSPAVVQLVRPDDLVMATTDLIPTDGHERPALMLRPMKSSWRARNAGVWPVSKLDLIPYLTAPADPQMTLSLA